MDQSNDCAQLPPVIDPVKALDAFKSQLGSLILLVENSLTSVVVELYSKRIISRDAKEEAMNQVHIASVRTVSLLNAVEAKIEAEPNVFAEFVSILQSELTLRSQAKKLILEYHSSSFADHAVPAHPSAIHRYGDYLKEVYNTSLVSCDGKFPPTPSKKYIKLALVKGGKCRDLDELMKHTLLGKVDEILNGKTEITIDAISQDGEGRPPKVVLVEGPPGIGKSILAWELCRRWDRAQYDLVVLHRLREKEVQQMQNVADLFPHDNKKLQYSVAEEVVDKEGQGVLLILDGYDELPLELRHKPTALLSRLLNGRSLPKCTVVVTSRPSATDDLYQMYRPQIHRNVEILGFTQECIKDYAYSILSSQPDVLEDFMSYISASENPAINTLMYIPLNAAIIVEIYSHNRKKGIPIPKTMTQLYTQLCCMLLQRSIKADNPSSKTVLTKFPDLPDSYLVDFEKLSKLAYETFKEHKIVFDSEIFRDDFSHFSFLDSVSSLYGRGGVSYNFLHLTLHEFLAAYHISQLLNGIEIFHQYENDPRWNVVWKFVSGLTGFDFFRPVAKSDMFKFPTEERFEVKVFLMQCLFEAQVAFDYKYMYNSDKILVRSDQRSYPLDRYALGYCVANCSYPISWEVELKMKSGNSFMWGLKSGRSEYVNLKRLRLDRMSPKCLEHPPIKVLQGISFLEICIYHDFSNPQIVEEHYQDTESFLKNILKMRNLTLLSLALPRFPHVTFKLIPQSNVTTLKLFLEINFGTFSHLDLTKEAFLASMISLVKSQSHSKLRCLSIIVQHNTCMHLEGREIHREIHSCNTKPLCDIIYSATSLQLLSITLSFFSLSAGSLASLETNTRLTCVHILSQKPGNYIPMLTAVLRSNETLKILTTGYIANFSKGEVQHFNRALSTNMTLKRLFLGIVIHSVAEYKFFSSNSRLSIYYRFAGRNLPWNDEPF